MTDPYMETLADAFCEAERRRTAVAALVCNPQCGKPGRGFKAARKLAKTLAEIDATLAAITQTIEQWIRHDKANYKRRAARRAAIDNAIAVLSAQ